MSQSESNRTDDCENRRIERAKGVFDGAESLDEMIAQLDAKKEELESLQEEGWELDDSIVVNDYAHLSENDE